MIGINLVLVHSQSALHLVSDTLARAAMNVLVGAALSLVESFLGETLVGVWLGTTV
jgi:hypothetical protein